MLSKVFAGKRGVLCRAREFTSAGTGQIREQVDGVRAYETSSLHPASSSPLCLAMHSVILYLLCIAAHILVLSLLSARRWHLSTDSGGHHPSLIPSNAIKLSGGVVAMWTLALPYAGPDDPLQQCGARVACFFFAFKLLDLAWTKSEEPPKLLQDRDRGSSGATTRARYVRLLLCEMRYHSFDIRAVQKARPMETASGKLVNTAIPPLVLVTAAYAFPIAETKCALLLCIIQNGLEGVHSLLHPRCPYSLFHRPFAAATLGDFWTLHWHASAVFLQSLAYRPCRKLVGRWFGVLSAFGLSGVWHGWAAAPLVDDERAMRLGLQVCTFFGMLGVGTIVERLVWGDRQGGMLQRVLAWMWALGWAGWCFRTLESHSKIAFLRKA